MGWDVTRQLMGDNKAALSLCVAETGPWRTSQFRLRASKLREAIQGEGARWSAHHLQGTALVADGLTKSLLGQSHVKFMNMLSDGSSLGCETAGVKGGSSLGCETAGAGAPTRHVVLPEVGARGRISVASVPRDGRGKGGSSLGCETAGVKGGSSLGCERLVSTAAQVSGVRRLATAAQVLGVRRLESRAAYREASWSCRWHRS